MSKFNTRTRGVNKTVNHEGAEAYKLTPELELYSLAVTSMLSDKYYESEDGQLERLQDLIKKVDPVFVAKLAVYARTKMHLRTLPLVMVVELAKRHSGDNLVSRTIDNVVLRADEITELLAYYEKANARTDTKKLNKLSSQIKRGLARAFTRFDEYQFAKYNRDSGVKLRDALFVCHPKPTDEEMQKLFDKIESGTLATPYTWETKLSEIGKIEYESEEAKKKAFTEAWEELIDSEKLGYMALLRNLRNIIKADVTKEHIAKVANRLGDAEQVRRSKQFPFRFLSAYRQIASEASGSSTILLDALEDAMLASAENIKGFGYDTSVLIASDVSGSMNMHVSRHSTIQYYDIGLVLSMLLQNRCKDVVTGIFGTDFKVKNLPKKNILSNVSQLNSLSHQVGWATNGYMVIKHLIDENKVVDKVMIFTDLQLWDSYFGDASLKDEWMKYKKIAPDAKLYLFDLAGYGTTPLSTPQSDVYLIAGWSDKVFDMLEAYEQGSNAVDEIKSINL